MLTIKRDIMLILSLILTILKTLFGISRKLLRHCKDAKVPTPMLHLIHTFSVRVYMGLYSHKIHNCGITIWF